MRKIFVVLFAALFFTSPLFAADNMVLLPEKPYSSFVVGSTLYVISETGNRMYLVNTTTNKLIRSIKLDNGPTVGIVHNGKIYITNSEDKTVSVYYDTGSYKTLSVVGAGPIAIVPIGGRLYVASSDDLLTIIDAAGDSRLDDVSLRVGGNPSKYMTVLGNRIFIHHPLTNSVSVFTTSGNKILKNFPVGKSPQSSVLVGKTLYVINRDSHDVTVINTDTYETIATIPVGTSPMTGLLVNKKIYINNTASNNISVIDTESNTSKTDIPVGKNPVALILQNKILFVINREDDTVSVIDTMTGKVVDTFQTGKNPLSGSLVGNTLYINNSEENTTSFFSTVAPVLSIFTSSSTSGEYREGDKINILAGFNQNLGPGSTMSITLNNGVKLTLSTIDKIYLRGTYTIGSGETVADLSVKQVDSAQVRGMNTLTGINYILPPSGKNLGDLKKIVIKTSSQTTNSDLTCQKLVGLYRLCPFPKPVQNYTSYQSNLLCEGIITDDQADRKRKSISLYEGIKIAVNMRRATLKSSSRYVGSFGDVSRNMYPVVQAAMDQGLIADGATLDPHKSMNRIEAYTLLMESVCLTPVPSIDQEWSERVYETASAAGVTKLTWEQFKPQNRVTRKEVFLLASHLADWADTTGGCKTQNICR